MDACAAARRPRRQFDAERAQLDALVQAEYEQRTAELKRSLAAARSELTSLLVEESRRLGEEWREEFAERERRAAAEYSMRLVQVQKRVEDRLTAWAHDLERTTGEIEGQVSRLEALQKERLAKVERTLDPGGGGAPRRGRRAARGGAAAARGDPERRRGSDPAGDERARADGGRAPPRPARGRRAAAPPRARPAGADLARGGRRDATAGRQASPRWSAGRPNGSGGRSSARPAASSRPRRRSSTRQSAPRATRPSAGSRESSTTRSPSTRAAGCAIRESEAQAGGAMRRALDCRRFRCPFVEHS